MLLTLNGNKTIDKLATFTDIPNIVRVDENQYTMETGSTGQYAQASFVVYSGSYDTDKTYSLTINGYKITSTPDINNLTSTSFLTSNYLGHQYSLTMAYYITTALQNTPLGASYNFYVIDEPYDTTGAQFIMKAKRIGSKYNITNITNDFPSGYLTYTLTEGYTNESTFDNAKILIDLFANTDNTTQDSINDMSSMPSEYIVRMEKWFVDGGVRFNISPLLKSITTNGNTTQYGIRAAYVKNGKYTKIGTLTNLLSISGYQVNLGKNYLTLEDNKYTLLQNCQRGTENTYTNNTTLYCMNNEKITVSVLTPDKGSVPFTVNYLDSTYNVIATILNTSPNLDNSTLHTVEFIPNNENAFYVNVQISDNINLLYNVIKPNQYNKEVTTVYFNNSYGGVSFFNFTGSRTEQRTSEKTTYTPQALDFYTNSSIKRLEKIYTNNRTYNVTLKSHYIEKNAIYQLYDLNNSNETWIYINNIRYDIIIDSIDYNEIQRDVFEITLTYHYSADELV